MNRQCARCGHLADEHDHFCAACGSALEPLAQVEDATSQTGILGLRTATEGDSAPMPAVDSTSVSGLGVGQAVLVVLRGPQEGARFLDDVTVSRHHADLLVADGGWELVDAGSLNGSYVNRRRIDDQRLVGGDEVQIGKYRFVYLEGTEAAEGGEQA